MRLAFRAAPTPEARRALAELEAAYPHVPSGGGRRHRGARRRRLHAGDPAPLPRRRPADLRHEPRHRRLPDERLPRGRSGGADRGRRARSISTPADARPPPRRRRSTRRSAINEVSLLPRDPPGRQAQHPHRRQVPACRSWSATASWSPRPAGSTAYNLSAHGPIIPLGAGLLALTPISAFRPRRWRGALLPTRPGSTSTSSSPASARSAPWPTSPRCATSARSRSGRTATSPAACCSTRSTTSRSASSKSRRYSFLEACDPT